MRLLNLLTAFVIVIVLSACGPAKPVDTPVPPPTPIPESTSTPLPTPTPMPTLTPVPTDTVTPPPSPTPVPYDLTVKVEDSLGTPVAGARLSLSVGGGTTEQKTGASGQVQLGDLPESDVTVLVSAQGYLPTETRVPLVRGPNEVAIPLERDPSGLLPAQACAVGETLLYIEDFQDGLAQGWPEIELGARGWGVTPDPSNPDNMVASVSRGGGGPHENPPAGLRDGDFDQAVWRLKLRISGDEGLSTFLNWLHTLQGGDRRYVSHMGPNVFVDLSRLDPDLGGVQVAASDLQVSSGAWHELTLSRFGGEVQVWLDGEQSLSFQDPKPLPAGTINLEPHFWEGLDGDFAFDDISVCQLSEPYDGAAPPSLEDQSTEAAQPVTAEPTEIVVETATEPAPQTTPEGPPVVVSPQDEWGLAVFSPGDAVKLVLMGDATEYYPVLSGHLENVMAMAIQDEGTLGGFQFSAVRLAGGCNDAEASAAAGQVVSDAAVVAVVGPLCSKACSAAETILDGGHVVQVSPSCSAPNLTETGLGTFNRVTYRDDVGGDSRAAAVVDFPAYVDFTEAYQARFGVSVESEYDLAFMAAYTYDAARIILEAAKQVAVMDESGNLVIGRRALADKVRATSGYQGVTGVISFDGKGDRQ